MESREATLLARMKIGGDAHEVNDNNDILMKCSPDHPHYQMCKIIREVLGHAARRGWWLYSKV